ncbi:MAG: hypothetical protein AVDCRST_MAG73-3440 [uncultured Thermomicrobiales bacterium]|uniref:PRC-barrel domain-containing protein n=1 Tax=uncultured Thermomicrobiales bacterium TaxID=1645740 RepID=A0A6J4URV4_9BACT|nr:MAG: hypothetical protein AVDCRST_MAG73-3440 [uncultured Thermomicrobiales bacterium]
MIGQDRDPKHATQAAAIPPELLVRRDRSIRLERGGKVYATDGLVGLLKHVVVDKATGELVSLAIAVDGQPRPILMPIGLVDKTAGTAVFLTMSRAQFQSGAPRAPQYDKGRFAAANLKTLLAKATAATGRDPRRAIARAGRDFLETPPVSLVEPAGLVNRAEGAA